jgi:hypothetical protein
VKDAQDFDDLAANAVRHQVSCALVYQFPRPWHSSGPPEARLFCQHGNRSENPLNDQLRSTRII